MKSLVRTRWMLLLLISCACWQCDGRRTYEVEADIVHIDSVDQIIDVHHSLVRPVVYRNISGLEFLPLHQAKRKFISAILPSILLAKHQIHNRRKRVSELKQKPVWDNADSLFYIDMKKIYKARTIDDMMSRMISLPTSIVLAQAAIETGWGKSRFFVQASNLFGIWSFDENESRIAAGTTRNDKIIFLRSYDDMSRSINDYFEVLGRHNAYKSLRNATHKTSDPYALIVHLKNYSERKGWYTRQLKKVIRQNNLMQYDNYRIDPVYFE